MARHRLIKPATSLLLTTIMSAQGYIHRAFWDSMQRRLAEAIFHFEPLVMNAVIAHALDSELASPFRYLVLTKPLNPRPGLG